MAFIAKIKTRAGKQAYAVRWSEGGKVKQRQFPFASDAKSFAAQKEIEQNPQQTRREQSQAWSVAFGKFGPTFNDMKDEWLVLKEEPTDGSEPLEPSTLRAYRRYLANVGELIGEERVARIREDHFETVLADRKAAGNANSTIKLHLSLTTNVLEHARSRGVIRETPTHGIKLTQGRRERIVAKKEQDEKPYSPDEIYTMLAAADDLAKDDNLGVARAWRRYRPLTYFLAYTGARISEARAWRWQDYLPDENRIRIHQKAGDGTDIGEVKTVAAVRKLPLHEPLRAVLDELKRPEGDALVFATSKGTPVSYANLLRRMLAPLKARTAVLAERAEDPRFVRVGEDRAFHAFRHFYASNLVRSGANLKQLQTYCGHSNPAFTLLVYGHLFDDDGDALIGAFKL
ncbi:MAG: site-specific integrase [Pseudomonadota bacterium]